ncbi:MAG: ADP-ribosylglycohydrolase family protein [Clostridia bacterium]|nr:ADP-ribosylglycohydrolase family protein [Clostridia bacterium]MBR6524162.1 ADP-ribosylglycohydrolase family protein [Clostridia bacterium]
MKLNRKFYEDKVRACWIGKNIGGTMGGPYEGRTEMQDATTFVTPKGEPLPNDDLDLQILWLCAMEERGAAAINEKVLGEYWLNYVPAQWNEYGIAKRNMAMGIHPPYSGEYNNEKWRDSNGAWIRTEIWACMFPAYPEFATRYAFYDACVDHGTGEGTYAAIFVAAMESAAFFEKDVNKLIETGLSYIPENCKLAQSVRLACKLYEEKTDFKEARNKIVEANKELGWFQAPGNVAFVILGLLYGEGDFKKSMIHAINCGDDTDCTGATIGSLMGIMYGTEGIPKDWTEYIGDRIITVAIDRSYVFWPKTCEELTQRTLKLVPSALAVFGVYMEYTDGENELEGLPIVKSPQLSLPESGLCLYFDGLIYSKGRVEFSKYRVVPGDEITLKFTFNNLMNDARQIEISMDLPEGWTAERKTVSLMVDEVLRYKESSAEVKIFVGEDVDFKNIIKLCASTNARPTKSEISLIIWG